MTLLRSREVSSSLEKKDHSDTSPKSGVEIQPLTPAKVTESIVQTSNNQNSDYSGSISNQGLRRSARLSSKSVSYNVGSTRKRKAADLQNGEEESGGSRRRIRNVRVSRELNESDFGTVRNDDEEEIQSVRKLETDVQAVESEPVREDDAGKRRLNLRSGKKLLKQEVNSVVTSDVKLGFIDNGNGSDKNRKRFSREDKKKEVFVDADDHIESELETKSKTMVVEETENDGNNISKMDQVRLLIEEKGKRKVDELDSSSNLGDTKPEVETVAETVSMEDEVVERAATSTGAKMDHMERFKDIAKRNATRFAYFSAQDEEEDEVEEPEKEANDDVEDWPGPFSTAMKIIRERAENMSGQQKVSASDKSQSVPLKWVPKEKQDRLKVAPSLQELCMPIIAENVDAISSLESVPDVIRHKLTHLLCDSRKMNNHFFELLANGSPSEIRIKDCSWLNEEHFTKTFEKSDTSNLNVLQLDQCGRCLPDYVVYSTLGQVPNKLSALTTVSLKGACRLSDNGLNALIGSAPSLRSINLGCCSLLTSDSIFNLAEKLGSILKELYIDECFGIDAMSILPALVKMECLEVLSMSRSETVTNTFIKCFVAVRGQKMKELVFADCTKLTDKSLKAIAEDCPGLLAIDLSNVCKLTDAAIGHLANGCQAIQTMKFCRNAFSDEGVAAYVEACGESLTELSLNHVDKVGNQTALSLSKHARNLSSLDLSWCRDMTNEAVGLIVDSCVSLKMLKLFGCTQITDVLIDGHSNKEVKMVGLKGSQILKNRELPHLLPLRYSSL